MVNKIKLFLLMSFVTCVGGGFLKASEGEQRYMITLKKALEADDKDSIKNIILSVPKLENDENKRFLAFQVAKNRMVFDKREWRGFLKKLLEQDKKDSAERRPTVCTMIKEFLFDMQIGLHEQERLRQSILVYLEQEGRDQEFIEKIENIEGFCVGLSFLWGYGKRLQDEPIIDPTIERDDYDFFNKMYRTLVLWDGITVFDNNQKKDIDRFLSNIMLFQRGNEIFDLKIEGGQDEADSEDASIYFEDLKVIKNTDEAIAAGQLEKNVIKRRLEKVCSRTFYASKSMLVSRLQNFIKPKMIIMITVQNDNISDSEDASHVVALYKSDNDAIPLKFYDSNDDKGERSIYSKEELADPVWQVFKQIYLENKRSALQGKFLFQDPYLVGYFFVDIYRFADDSEYSYPAEKELEPTLNELSELFDNECLPLSFYKNEELKEMMGAYPDKIIQLLQQDTISDQKKERIILAVTVSYPRPELQKVREYIEEQHQEMLQGILMREQKMIQNLTHDDESNEH